MSMAMMRLYILNICFLFFVALVSVIIVVKTRPAFSSENAHPVGVKSTETSPVHDHEAHEAAMKTEEAVELVLSIGVDEKPGEKIPLDPVFKDENGHRIHFGDVVTRPTIILPVFFYCPVVCPLLLSSLASALNDVPFDAGVDYHVVALSFNDEETPDMAKDSKAGYMRLLPESFPKSSWTFLTGERQDILRVTDAIGYRFKKTGENTFIHPNALVVIAEDGTVIRYLYGSVFLGADIGMAISEAKKGTPGISIKRILSFCFNYDPENRRFVLIIFKITAAATMLSLVLFFIFFLRTSRQVSKKDKEAPRSNLNVSDD